MLPPDLVSVGILSILGQFLICGRFAGLTSDYTTPTIELVEEPNIGVLDTILGTV